MKRLMPLDGLRGLAVLLVLGSHASNAGYDLAPGLDARGLGRSGVFLFFVLSSFLLTRQLLRGWDRAVGEGEPGRRGVGWARFGARRLLRILPAYALTLGLYVGLGAFEPRVGLEHLALIRAEHHFWTIPVEVLFYLALPLVAFSVGPLARPWLRVLALGVAALLCRWIFPPLYPAVAPDFRPNVAPFLPIFLTGAALAAGEPLLVRLSPRWLLGAGGAALAGLGLMAPAVFGGIRGEPVHYARFHLWFDAHGVLWATVCAAVLSGSNPLARVFSWAPLRWLGHISYSVYLLHALALGFLDARWRAFGLPHTLVGPAFLLGSILLGTLSYILVERPFLGLLAGPRGGSALRPQTTPPRAP